MGSLSLERHIRRWSIYWRSCRCMCVWCALALYLLQFLTAMRTMKTIPASPSRSFSLSLMTRWRNILNKGALSIFALNNISFYTYSGVELLWDTHSHHWHSLLLYISLIFCVFFLLSACPSWIRAVSFPVLQLRTSPSVVCPPCHLHWPCGRRRLRWSS